MALYDGDSFFTLTLAGRIGLLALSALLSVALIWASWRVGRSQRRFTRILIALALFYGFVWLSPQIYYSYYLMVFDGLPLQLVVGAPPGPDEAVRLLALQGASNLSDHGKAMLGWVMIVVAMVLRTQS